MEKIPSILISECLSLCDGKYWQVLINEFEPPPHQIYTLKLYVFFDQELIPLKCFYNLI